MSRKTTIGHEAVRLTVSKVVTLTISMINSMLLARFRTLEEYGTYSQLLLVTSLVTSLLMLGLPNSINFFLARAETDEEKRRFTSVYYTFSTILSLIIGASLVLSVPLIEMYFHNSAISKFYYFLALYPWAHIISSSIEHILVVFQRTNYLIYFRLFHSVAMLGSVAVVQWLGFGFNTYMIAFIAINSIFAILVYFVAHKLNSGIYISLEKNIVKSILSFSIPIGLATVVGTLNTEIDKLLIGYLMDTEQMAIYTNAAKELPLTIVGASITTVLLPQMSLLLKQNKEKSAIKLWNVATELSLIIVAVMVRGVFTYAEDVMTFLYSEKYLPGISVFRIYTLNLLMRITYFGIVLNASGETKKIFICSIISLVLNSILNPIFYFAFGMIGPALATFLAILLVLILQIIMTTRVVKIQFTSIFPWKSIFHILIINICFSFVFYYVKQLLPIDKTIGSLLESILLGIIWLLFYFMLMKKKIVNNWEQLNKGSE